MPARGYCGTGTGPDSPTVAVAVAVVDFACRVLRMHVKILIRLLLAVTGHLVGALRFHTPLVVVLALLAVILVLIVVVVVIGHIFSVLRLRNCISSASGAVYSSRSWWGQQP